MSPVTDKAGELSPTQKAAVVLLSLPDEAAADVLRRLPRDLVDRLMAALANLGVVDLAQRTAAVQDAETLFQSIQELVEGGWEAAQRVLEQAFGPSKAQDMLRRLTAANRSTRPFARLSRMDPDHLATVVGREHPQTVALVLAHLEPRAAAQLLAQLPEALSLEATYRLARLDRIPPAAVADLESTLETHLAVNASAVPAGGVDAVVPILNATDTARERLILDGLAAQDAELAQVIRNQLFTFEDLQNLDQGTLHDLLRRFEPKVLALALKSASAPLRDKVFANLSEQAAAVLQEEVEALGRVRMRDVEEAQHSITELLHQLEESGEIVLPHGGDEEGYVE